MTAPPLLQPESDVVTLANGHVVIDLGYYPRTVHVDGKEIHLTRLEKLILFDLAEQAGQIVPKDRVAELWGEDSTSEGELHSYLYLLRCKLAPYGDRLIYLRGRGFLLYHDNFTHLPGAWINLNGVAVDLRSGLMVGKTRSHLLKPAHIEILSSLRRKNIHVDEEDPVVRIHVSQLRKTLTNFPELQDEDVIVTILNGYTLGVSAKPMMAPIMPDHAKETLLAKSQWRSSGKQEPTQAFLSAAFKNIPIPDPLPQSASFRQLSYDLSANLCFLNGQKIKVSWHQLELIAVLVLAAQKGAGVKKEVLNPRYAGLETQYLNNLVARINTKFRKASLPDESERPFIASRKEILRLTYPEPKTG